MLKSLLIIFSLAIFYPISDISTVEYTILSQDTLPNHTDVLVDDSTYLFIDTAVYRVSKADSIHYEQLKKVNLTWWEKLNRDNLCTGMKAPYQYRNGKIVKIN